MVNRFGVATLAFVGFVASPSALAQLSVGYFGQMNVNAGLTATMNAATLAAAKRSRRAAAEADQGALRYRPSAKTSENTQRALIALVEKNDQNAAKQLADVLASRDIIAMFPRDMKPYGLKPDNVADALTAYPVGNWMIINQAEVPQKEKVTAVQNNISHAMDSKFNALTNEQRQTLSELLIYQTMFAIGSRTAAQGNAPATEQLASQSHQNLLAMGIDMRKLDLTTRGLVPR